MKRAAFLAFAVPLTVTLFTGCKPKPGNPCSGAESLCSDKNTALACQKGAYVAVACAGPLACTKYQDHANCDTSVAGLGSPCMGEEDEYACTPDKKHALACKGGKFAPYQECRGPAGCAMLGRTVSCDLSIAVKADPCKTQGATACSDDKKEMLVCRDGKFDTFRFCRGQYGCAVKDEAPACDETISLAGDPCGIPGQVVCATDGKAELVCMGGSYTKSLSCKTGCTVSTRPGRPIDCR